MQYSPPLPRASTLRPSRLAGLATVIVIVASLPLLFIIANALELGGEQWARLWSIRLPGLLWNTLSLATLVAVFAMVLGISSAWLIARRDFAGRRLAVWLMVLPLTIPTYVFAHIYTVLLERDGWLGSLWVALIGGQPPSLYNETGVALILAMASFSYIFLLVTGALSRSSKSLEEAALLAGASRLEVFRRINLPLLRPAIAAGTAVIVLHVLSDFGAVSMLRFQTFTLAIYTQMSGRMDYQAAAALSMVLIVLSLSFLILERFFRNRQRYYTDAQAKPAERQAAQGGELLLIWGWLGLISLFAFILPVVWMLGWSWQALIDGMLTPEFWGYALNSGLVAFAAATLALVVAFPVAFFHARRHSPYSQSLLHVSSVGFALPGPVIALGVLAVVLSQLPWIYGTLAALLLAMIVRFLPLAVQAEEAALAQLTPSIEQAGRLLGASPLDNLRRVTLPIIRSGLATAWVLVFIDTLKELPATLILRPTGFDTLPVRIWIEASEEMLELAAPAALLLVIGTLPAIWLMLKGQQSQN